MRCGSATVSSNIVAFNSQGLYNDPGCSPFLSNNCVYNPGGYDYSGLSPGAGDISADPLFVSYPSDLHLKITSPCINSGANRYVTTGLVDMDGQPRILPVGGTVDIGADEYSAHPVWSPGEAKKLVPNGQEAYLTARGPMIVTAEFEDMPAFYVEQSDRASGIQCRADSLLDPGQCGVIYGLMDTIDGERVLTNAAAVLESLSTALIPEPLGMGNHGVVGGTQGLQEGIFECSGLNNIGLLVRTWGQFTKLSETEFAVDDGSGVSVKCVVPAGVALDPDPQNPWQYVVVTGISSCYRDGDDLKRLLRVREQVDIVPVLP